MTTPMAWCEVVSPWFVFGAGVCAAIAGEMIGFVIMVLVIGLGKRK